MVQPPKKPVKTVNPVTARRRLSRHATEVRRQRQIRILAGTAIGIALLALVIGVLFDQVFIPNQAVARVNAVSLSRGDYWREKRTDSASNISQALFLTAFGPQFAQQVLGQVGALDTAITTLRSDPVDETTINSWVEREMIKQGAAKLNLTADAGEVAQLIDASFGPNFGPMITATDTLTPTAAPTFTPAPTLPPTVTPGGPTLTPAPTMTLAPTFTPLPTQTPTVTPPAAVAVTRSDTIYNTLYSRYLDQLAQIDPARKAQLTEDDFKIGLYNTFERQALTEKIQKQLVPEESFTPTTDPSSIETRHILLRATVPISATEQEREAAFAARQPEAEALLKQVLDGGDFDALAKEKTEDYSTKESGGVLSTFDKDGKTVQGTQMDPAIVAAVAPLADGQTAPSLVRTSFGWHIVQLIKRTVDDKEQQLQAARTKAFDAWLVEQRAAAQIERFPAVTPTATALPTGTAAPLPTAGLAGEPTPTALPSPTPLPQPTDVATPAAATPGALTPTIAATLTPTP
jgi:hypothetical protein